MRRGAGAERAVGDLVGLGLRRRDQIGDGAKRRFWIDDDDVGRTRDQCDGRKILVRVERQFGVQARIDGMGKRPHQQRVAIAFGGRDRLRADNGARARLVFDDDAGAEILCHLLRQHAGNGVGAAARRKGNDDLDDAVRIGGKSRRSEHAIAASTNNMVREIQTFRAPAQEEDSFIHALAMQCSMVHYDPSDACGSMIIRATTGIFLSSSRDRPAPPSVPTKTTANLTTAGQA